MEEPKDTSAALPTPDPSLLVEVVSAKSLQCSLEQVSHLQLHVLFGQRVVRSSPTLCIASSDPVFDFSCSFSMSFLETAITTASLVNLDLPVLIYVTATTDPHDVGNVVGASAVRTLLAAAVLDFRYSLLYNEDYVSVELLPCELDGCHMGLSGGFLYVRLSLQNISLKLSNTFGSIRHEVEDSIHNYQSKLSQENRDLYLTVKSWWSKIIKQYPHVNGRVIKILTEDEIGCHRSVCSLIFPIPAPREMTSPRHAARFVSLIPFKRDAGVTGGRVETWRSTHAILSRRQGDVEDHALLLCSMLLGWGLDAWVALGTIQAPTADGSGTSQRPYCWVATFDIPPASEVATTSEPKVTFWEALSGQQYELPHPSDDKNDFYDKNQKHSFCELHCLFRHNCFMLNTQPVCAVPNYRQKTRPDVSSPPVMSFCLSNENNFSLFPRHAISPVLQHPGCGPHLTQDEHFSHLSHISAMEASIEKALHEEIANVRYERGLYTNFDEKLSLILQPVLASYELDRVVGATFGNADFQCAIRRNVKQGECFKAFPTCFSHTNSSMMLMKLRRSEAAMDVIMTAGRGCRHGLRVRVNVYPEGILAVWVMLAVCAEKSPGGVEK